MTEAVKLAAVWHSLGSGFLISKGPNGTIQIDQMNALQGWHNGYLTPKEARSAGEYLISLADEMSQEAANL